MGTSLVAPVRADVFCTQSNDGHDGAVKMGLWRMKTINEEPTLSSEVPRTFSWVSVSRSVLYLHVPFYVCREPEAVSAEHAGVTPGKERGHVAFAQVERVEMTRRLHQLSGCSLRIITHPSSRFSLNVTRVTAA